MVGHSSGEIAAAFAVGAISRESAWKLSYHRGVLSSDLARSMKQSPGAMLSAALSPEEAQPYLVEAGKGSVERDLTIACINSPKNVTISGSLDGITHLKRILDAKKIFARKLEVENAYHSIYMNPIAGDYTRLVGDLEPSNRVRKTEQALSYSSVTGSIASPKDLQTVEYWIRNLVSPVLFLQSITSMLAETTPGLKKIGSRKTSPPITELLEIGPHGALRGPLREIISELPRLNKINYKTLLIYRSSTI